MNKTPPPLIAETSSRLLRWLLLLSRRLRKNGAKDKLSAASLQVLGILYQGRSATATELAAELGIKKQSLTLLLSALHEKGYLGRKREPGDARRISLSLTISGNNVFLDELRGRRAILARLIEENLSAAEVASILKVLPIMEKLMPGSVEPGRILARQDLRELGRALQGEDA
jgi:DNA-binding MarR family transcriptional regulator